MSLKGVVDVARNDVQVGASFSQEIVSENLPHSDSRRVYIASIIGFHQRVKNARKSPNRYPPPPAAILGEAKSPTICHASPFGAVTFEEFERRKP